MSARSRPGLVYFMKPVGLDGPIKIGHSWCPENRLVDLSAWSPWPLELIGAVAGVGKDERFLHSCFADCHSHREWFHSTPRLRDTIAKILQARTIDTVRDLKSTGSIRRPRKNSENASLRMSYRMRLYWLFQRMAKADGSPCYYTAAPEISAIMDRWGDTYRRRAQPPTTDEIGLLEAFILNPAGAVRVERKLRVVA